MKQNSGLAHCVHHDIHWEYCYNYQKRVEFIKENKPKEEQELRLKLFKLLPNKLVPGRESAEWKACIKAVKSYNKALQSCIEELGKFVNIYQGRYDNDVARELLERT